MVSRRRAAGNVIAVLRWILYTSSAISISPPFSIRLMVGISISLEASLNYFQFFVSILFSDMKDETYHSSGDHDIVGIWGRAICLVIVVSPLVTVVPAEKKIATSWRHVTVLSKKMLVSYQEVEGLGITDGTWQDFFLIYYCRYRESNRDSQVEV